MNFFSELRRRNIYKVAVAYVIVAWLLIQAALILFPTFEAPPWVLKVFVTAIMLGFPVALILAWAFELTPEGLKRTEDVDLATGRALELDPRFYLPHYVLGWIEMKRGTNYAKVIEEYRLAQTMESQPILTAALRYAYARNGQKDKAMEMLDELNPLARGRFVSPSWQALIYLGPGENSQAIDWLEKAYEERSPWLDWLKVEPLFDPLRSGPRFQALYKKMNFRRER
jgi:tetratricopeptide (TPR) repeat protein